MTYFHDQNVGIVYSKVVRCKPILIVFLSMTTVGINK